jgi:hypothetical protein
MLCNTAIFYDIENLLGLFSSSHNNTSLQLDEVYRRVLETEGVSGVSIQRAYTDWGLAINRNLRNSVLQIGIEPVQIFNTNQNDKVKNAADVSLIIDAVDLLQKRPDIENYVIVSGDGIFAFLAKKLHEYGKRVIGVGFTRNANMIFRNACDYYIALEKGDKALTATTVKSALKGQSAANGNGTSQQAPSNGQAATAAQSAPVPPAAPAAQKPPAPPADAKAPANADANPKAEPVVKVPTRRQGKIPEAFPKTKFTDALVNAEFPVWYKPEQALNNNGSLLAIRNMLNTLFAGTDDNADLEISVLMNYVNYYVPGFSIGQFNFKRFREFMRLVTTASPYCLFQDGTIIRVTRRGMVGNKGKLLEDISGLVVTLSDGSKLKSFYEIPDGTEFTYSLAEQEKPKPAPKKQQRKANGKAKPAAAPASVNAAEQSVEAASDKPAAVPVKQDDKVAPAEDARLEAAMDSVPAAQSAPADDNADKPQESFIIVKDMPKPAPQAAPVEQAAAAPIAPVAPVAEEQAQESDTTSVRKTIKAGFMTLSINEKLPTAECRRLCTQEYCQKTFGVKAPVFREIETKANLQEQRMINGKVRYWKDVFKFNNRMYLVFKEWSAHIHKDRFLKWLKAYEG